MRFVLPGGGLFSSPAPPQLPPPPPPLPTTDDSAVQEKKRKTRIAAQSRKGLLTTNLTAKGTGAAGSTSDDAPVQRKTLLGK